MIFALTSVLCLIVALWASILRILTTRRAVGGAADPKAHSYVIPQHLLLAASTTGGLLGLALLMFFLEPLSPVRPDPLGFLRPPVVLLLGGVCGVVIYSFIALRGLWLAWTIAVAHWYLAYTAMDHLAFWGDGSQSGILVSEIGKPAGIVCDAPFLLVQEEGDSSRWRCPHNVVMGSIFKEPFAPWPAYSSGNSHALKAELDKRKASSVHADSPNREVKNPF